MSTKLRVMLAAPGMKPLFGSKAVASLYKNASKTLAKTKLPDDWDTMSTRDRLILLAKNMAKGWKLTIWREPRLTRFARSKYKQQMKEWRQEKLTRNPFGMDRIEEAANRVAGRMWERAQRRINVPEQVAPGIVFNMNPEGNIVQERVPRILRVAEEEPVPHPEILPNWQQGIDAFGAPLQAQAQNNELDRRVWGFAQPAQYYDQIVLDELARNVMVPAPPVEPVQPIDQRELRIQDYHGTENMDQVYQNARRRLGRL